MPWESKHFNYSDQSLTDEEVQGLPSEARHFEEVNLSKNLFGPIGVRSIVDFVLQQRQLKILKLYRCGLNDESVELLSTFCAQYGVLEELHLSHNRVTGNGAVPLIYACEQSRTSDQVPLWLRLEHNFIAEPEQVLCELAPYSICDFKGGWCGTKYCARRRRLHLPHFTHQDLVQWEETPSGYYVPPVQDELTHRSQCEPSSEDRESDNSEVDCRGRGMRAWHGSCREVCNERSRSPLAKVLDPHQLLAWQEKLLRRERELDELERLAMRLQ